MASKVHTDTGFFIHLLDVVLPEDLSVNHII